MHQFLIDVMKELERVITPPEHCHHALTCSQYGSPEKGWKDCLALQVNIAGKFHCVLLMPKDLEKSAVELAEEIRDLLRKPMESEQLGVGFGQYTSEPNTPLKNLREYIQKTRDFNEKWIGLHLRDGHPGSAARRKEIVAEMDGYLAALDAAAERKVQ
ncbi:MAG TPA: hypothetical protein VM554_15160 [Acidisarcina sp.]|nr:hypothetical protein [Acidisarcina sp.]